MPSNPNESRRGNHFSGGGQSNNNAHKAPDNARPSETAEFMSAYFASSPRKSNAVQGSSSQNAQETPRGAQTASTVTPPTTTRRVAQPHTPSSKASSNRQGTRVAASGHNPRVPGTSQPQKKRMGKGKIAAIVIAVVVAFVVVVGGACGFVMYRDYQNITATVPTLKEQASTLKDSVMAGDGETLRTTAATISSEVGEMHDALNGLPWQLASLIPVVGQDVQSARTLVSEADSLCQYALIPACESLADVKLSNLVSDGAINVDLVESLVNTLQNVSPVIQQSAETIDALPEAHIDKFGSVLTQVQDLVHTADTALTSINEVAPYLTQMLGADGVRNYLLVAQNNVELRSTGGFPGSVGVLTLTDGKIHLGDFTSVAEGLEWYDEAGFGVTEEEKALFGDRVGKIPADTSYIFDFPRAYTIFSEMYKDQKGGTIDGVVAIDPVFLQYMFKLTGGVNINGTEVNGDNAARLLMHDAYTLFDNETQDQFFSAVAGAAFSNLMENLGDVDLSDFIDTARRGIEEHRIQAWMVNEHEEEFVKMIGAGGELKTDETAPQLGVYVGDDTASKISWYLSTNSSITGNTKNADGSTTYHVTTTLTNNLSLAEAATQPEYVTGYSPLKRNESDMFIHIYLVAPAGGSISNVASSGGDFSIQGWTPMSWNGFGVYTASPLINGQETVTVTYDVTTSANAEESLIIDTTPTAQTVAGWTQ